jgi:hypothetical protein
VEHLEAPPRSPLPVEAAVTCLPAKLQSFSGKLHGSVKTFGLRFRHHGANSNRALSHLEQGDTP